MQNIQRTSVLRYLLFSLLLSFLVSGCSANLLIRHRSETSKEIHVYVNWELFCVVKRDNECSKTLEPGRYYFYAFVPNEPKFVWASAKNPTPFSIDKRTVIDLHDLKRRSAEQRPKTAYLTSQLRKKRK